MNFNPRMRFVWISQAFIIIQLIFLWSMLIYLSFPIEGDLVEGIPNRLLIVGPALALSALILLVVAVGAELFYRNFEYLFSDDAFIIRKGIIKRREYIIPYKEIESAKVLRSGVHTLDQVFGLTCILIRAGGRSLIIPGIAEPELFLRRLMAHVEGNEYIKNSEVYMSEREILLKLSSSVRNLQAKLDRHLTEQKHAASAQRARHEHPAEFLHSVKKDSDQLIDIKTFTSLKKPKKKKGDDKDE